MFFVNKIIYFIMLSQMIYFTKVMHLSDRKVDTIFKAFKSIFKYYYQHGFQLMVVTTDREFKPLYKLVIDLPGAPRLILTKANKDKPYIKRKIHVVKERIQTVRQSLLFLQQQKKKTSAALDNLFKINEDSEKLTPLQAAAFHT